MLMPETRRGKLEELRQTDEFIFQKLNVKMKTFCKGVDVLFYFLIRRKNPRCFQITD